MLTLLSGDDDFPDPEQALSSPNGLLAIGGDLSPQRIIKAYQRGIFPWYNKGDPVLWWSPDPRAVLFPERIKISHSLRRTLTKVLFTVTYDQAFTRVITACAASRPGREETWITDEMMAVYTELHHQGIAHSVEVWQSQQLVGGLYGLSIGRIFFGESMFSTQTDASKVALVKLAEQDFALIDCQVSSAHLTSLGAVDLPRKNFLKLLAAAC